MDPLSILFNHYPPDSPLADILIEHSTKVRDKALEIANRLGDHEPDMAFIAESAMLHDIGIGRTDAASIGCKGPLPYVCHGVVGRDLLEQCGLPRHALVCERHVGVGISKAEIQQLQLPLPLREMLPVTLEETIVCYADKFFSKKSGSQEHSVDEIVGGLAPYGKDKVKRFMQWHQKFTR